MMIANAAVTLLEKEPEKNIKAFNGIRTCRSHDHCVTGAVPLATKLSKPSKPHENGRVRVGPFIC